MIQWITLDYISSDSGESSYEEVSEEEEETDQQKPSEQVDGEGSSVTPKQPSAKPTPALSPVVTKATEEEAKGESGTDSPAVPTKPKYATHEEAKAAFKELLRDKVSWTVFSDSQVYDGGCRGSETWGKKASWFLVWR